MTSTKLFLAALFLAANSLLASSWAFSDPRELESLRAGIDFRGTATIAGTAESLSLSLYNVPDGANCTVPVETDSEGKDFVRFSWARPGAQASYSYSCTAETGRSGPKLLRDEPIPSAGFGNYTAPSELVVITPEIAFKAQGLIAGVDGEFLAASLLASWVHANMKYDKSYFGRVLDSRQVFEELTGVCEEYSHLLLALLRSVGIPSRYVTGLVYGQDGWAPHAWVEVFFPGQNVWIPFDPTYAEYGYVDASHIRFFDSIDGGFAASRTSFTYKALGQRPSVGWNDTDPKVAVEKEISGRPLLEVAPSGIDQTVRIGGHALVKANVRNVAGTLVYATLRLIYQAKNLGEGENLGLAFGNETVFVGLMPNEEKSVYWVLKVNGLYAITPKIMAENVPVADAGKITSADNAPLSSPKLLIDRDGYGTGDVAKLTVMLKGPAAVTELTTGASKTIPANGERAEFAVPARNGRAAVYSSDGGFAEIFLPLSGSGIEVGMDAPDRVLMGRPFEVVISSADRASQISAVLGNQSREATGGVLKFDNYTLTGNGILAVRVYSDNGETVTVLRKYVEVLPAPEITLSQADSSRPYLNLTITVRNGGLSFARVLSGQSAYARLSDSSGRLTFMDDSVKCGKRLELPVAVTYSDLLGQNSEKTYKFPEEVKCGPLDTLIQRILDFLLSLFWAGQQ